MPKAATFRNDFLKLLFNAVAIANIADNAAASPLTNLYLALHTSDPGTADAQTTNEISYGSYARVAVARSGAGWVVTANSVSPAANVDFPTASSGSATATHASIGTASAGTGKILWSGVLGASIAVSTGTTPRITTGSTITET